MIIDVHDSATRAFIQIKGCYFECGGLVGGVDGYAVNVNATNTAIQLLSENNTYINSGTDKVNPPDGAINISDYASMAFISCGDIFDGGTCGWAEFTVSPPVTSGIAIVENASLLHGSTVDTGGEVGIITVGSSTVAGMSEEG